MTILRPQDNDRISLSKEEQDLNDVANYATRTKGISKQYV